jgi:hypothetical protein
MTDGEFLSDETLYAKDRISKRTQVLLTGSMYKW